MRSQKGLATLALALLLAALLPCLAWAGGTPKQLWGAVRYSDGSIPAGGASEVSGTAWIVTRPGETVPVTTWYDAGANECYGSADIGTMPTPWAVGETAAVELTGDGTHHGGVAETNTLYVVLDASGSQYWGVFYLPVELTSFTAEGRPGSAVIRWSTATETDNLGFHLWRSAETDGEYARVNPALIPGAGTTTEPRSYTYTDQGLAPGTYWYKLQDVAVNGETKLHGPISVAVLPGTLVLTCTPHPVRDRALISFGLPERSPVTVRIYDVSGSQVATLVDEVLEPGSHSLRWSPRGAPSGAYHCKLEARGSASVRRIVVLK
jgi:hypothetical protein